MSKIIVGVDQSQGSSDAIALASSLAAVTGAELMLVNVVPHDTRPSRAGNARYEAYGRQDSHELLERLRSNLDGAAEVMGVADTSPAHGLHDLAERQDAALIVVGSTHTGRAGRLLPGSTAERLLQRSPCPVAVAPKGYAQRPGGEPGIIGAAYNGSQSAQPGLKAAHRLAAATGARLRVIRAFQPRTSEFPPASSVAVNWIGSYSGSLKERASKEVEAAVAKLDGEPRAEVFFAVGDAAGILIDASEQLDMLFVGSRGYGPMHSVAVGGVSGRVVREAACPVIVMPRPAGHLTEDSLFAQTASRAATA